MLFTDRQQGEASLRPRVAAPLAALAVLVGAALLGTVGNRAPRPLPLTVSLAVSADGRVPDADAAIDTTVLHRDALTQNRPFAFFLLNDPHKNPETSFAIVVARDRSPTTAAMADAVQEELARSWPERIQKTLPDRSSATELVANPALFPSHILPNGALYWETEAGTVFLITEADSFVITNDRAILFNQPVRRALQRFAKERPRGCQVYLQASAKEPFPPKWLSVELPTANRLMRWGTEYLKQEFANCITWG